MPSKVVTDVTRLVQLASLSSIEVFKLRAERKLDAQPTDEGVEISPHYSLGLDIREQRDGFRVRLLTEIATPFGEIACGAYSEYELSGLVIDEESSEAMTEFVNGVALMHLLPYVRQSIADLTQRVFATPLLMPIIHRGELQFQVDVQPADRKSAHADDN